MELIIPSPILNHIIRECADKMPNEAVGLLAGPKGTNGSVQAVAAAHNRSSTPQDSFYVDPFDQYRIERALDRYALECIGTFHSHPTKDAHPSGMDCEFMGDRVMVIVSMASGTYTHQLNGLPQWSGLDIRAWRAVDGATEEVDIVIPEVAVA